MLIYFLFGEHFPRARDFGASIMGVFKIDQKSIVDEYASHMALFVQALSLELAGESRYNLSYLYIVFQKLYNSDAHFSI